MISQIEQSSGDAIIKIMVNDHLVTTTKNTNPMNFENMEVWVSDQYTNYFGVDKVGTIERLVVSDVVPPSGNFY